MIGIGKKIKTGVFALMLSTMSVGLVHAESLNDALRWAYYSNPDLVGSRASVRQALEAIEQAKSGKRPQFDFRATYAANNSENSVGDRETNDYLYAELSASLLLWDGGQTDLAIDSAHSQVRSAQASLANTEQQVLLATVQAYLGVLEKEQNVKLQKNNAVILEKQVESANIAFDEGAATLAEVSAAKASAATAAAQVSLANAELVSAKQDYIALTGREPGDLSPVKPPQIPSSVNAIEDEAIRSAPSLIAAVELERSALYDYRRAQKNSNAVVSASASASRTDYLNDIDPSDDIDVGVSVSIPLGTGGRNPSLERQARAVLEQRSQQTNATRLSVAKSARVAYSSYQNAINSAFAYGEVVKAQSVANEGAAIEFELGASTILDKLDAEQNLLTARTNALRAEFNEIAAAYNVLAAIGKMEIGHVATGVAIINPLKQPSVNEPTLSENAQAVEKLQNRWGN